MGCLQVPSEGCAGTGGQLWRLQDFSLLLLGRGSCIQWGMLAFCPRPSYRGPWAAAMLAVVPCS